MSKEITIRRAGSIRRFVVEDPDHAATVTTDVDSAPRATPVAGSKLPNWPRGMSVETASLYVGVSRTKFLEEVAEGIWPPADRRGGRLVWDRRLLDQAFDRRSRLDHGSVDAMAMLEALE